MSAAPPPAMSRQQTVDALRTLPGLTEPERAALIASVRSSLRPLIIALVGFPRSNADRVPVGFDGLAFSEPASRRAV